MRAYPDLTLFDVKVLLSTASCHLVAWWPSSSSLSSSGDIFLPPSEAQEGILKEKMGHNLLPSPRSTDAGWLMK